MDWYIPWGQDGTGEGNLNVLSIGRGFPFLEISLEESMVRQLPILFIFCLESKLIKPTY